MNKLFVQSASTAALSGLLLITGCSSSSDSSGGVAAVPANAVVIDAANAEATVASSVTTFETLDFALGV